MASEELERAACDPARVPARAATCWCSTRSTARRTSTSTSSVGTHLLGAARPTRAGTRRGRLPAARAAPGGGGLRDLRPGDDAGAHAWAAARTASRSTASVGNFIAHAPGPAHPRRDARVRDQHQQRALLGGAGAALRRRVPGRPQRRARARLQHALDRLDGRRGAPHPDARRRVHVPARHQGRQPSAGRLRLLYEANPMALADRAGRRRAPAPAASACSTWCPTSCTSACR